MNAVFTVIIISSLLTLIIIDPSLIISSFSTAVEKSVKLTFTLLCIYVIWCGFSALLEKSGGATKLTKIFNPFIKLLFGKVSENTRGLLSMNLSCNLLGLNGLATPYAIDALKNLEEENNEHAKNMLFVISATSLQLLPTSAMQLLSENGAQSTGFIIVPSLIATAISTLIGIILCKVFK